MYILHIYIYIFFFAELIESTMYMYQATKDEMFLDFGKSFLTSIETTAKTKCGYASVSFSIMYTFVPY